MERRSTDSWVMSHLLQTVVLIILISCLIVTVIVKVGAYQKQNKSYQTIDLCRSLWALQHRNDNQPYHYECENE